MALTFLQTETISPDLQTEILKRVDSFAMKTGQTIEVLGPRLVEETALAGQYQLYMAAGDVLLSVIFLLLSFKCARESRKASEEGAQIGFCLMAVAFFVGTAVCLINGGVDLQRGIEKSASPTVYLLSSLR